jgi:uncharacterized 2Fe-2S/4Fe-4S cluster protein (DUF4445 family)
MNEIKITFQPSGRNVYVLPGTLMLEAAGRAGIILQTPCGGKGTCGKCKVRIINAKPEMTEGSGELSEALVRDGYRLACLMHASIDMSVEIPCDSLFEATEQILTGDTGQIAALHPVARKQFFELGEPAGHDTGSDAARLQGSVGKVDVPFALLQKLPGFLRANNWQGTAVVIGDRLVGLEVGDTAAAAYGVAMDLGTTTVVATLFDLATGRELALASTMNPQVSYGDDVIARISRVRENHGALTELQQVVVKAINGLIQTLTEKATVPARHIYEMVIAGNSTMQQILCGLDPSALGEVPFVQVFDAPLSIRSATLGLSVNTGGEVFVFPQVGGFVGGDTVAGVLAAGMDKTEAPTLLVDIGTNGEIVLSHNGELQATSTAAGPAFEGARIVQGMRATAGAIEKVMIHDDVLLNVIGNARPAGLCGTALIDAVAELLRKGLIDETGRIVDPADIPDGTPDALRHRLIEKDGQVNFLLVPGTDSASGEPIYLWQKDVRELQLATGAIRAGINILLRRAELEADDLGEVLLAGAFGNFIRRSNARRIGLLPQIPCNRIRFIGNAASLGAKLALLSADERARASWIRTHTEHVDLSLDPEFQMEFGMAMMFPTIDMDSCRESSEICPDGPISLKE